MEISKFLQDITQVPGASGFEEPVARKFSDAFREYCDTVEIDSMMNVHATVGVGLPHVGIFAHSDEIALMVSAIEEGFLRIERLGGVDPRILPGHKVRVLGKEEYPGIVGFKPPHLTAASETGKAVQLKDLYVDIGFDPDEVAGKVQVGDVILLDAPPVELMGGRLAGKTMDDRCLAVVMLKVAELLRERRNYPKITFVCTSQEEVGSRGAGTSAYKITPDLGIVLDVCHAHQPGADEVETCSLDKIAIGMGPLLHPGLVKRAKEVLKRIRLDYEVDIMEDDTSTDADSVLLTKKGIPTLLLSVPVKYMHTSVELLDTKVLDHMAEFLVEFLLSLGDWEDIVCY